MNALPTTAFLADDHPLVLRGLVDLLSAERDFSVIGTAADGKSALEKIVEMQPDIAVLDLVMPRLSGLDVLRELTQMNSPVRIIFLSALISNEQSIEAIAGGAFGILLKESAPEILIECLRLVRGGRRWFPCYLLDHKIGQTNKSSKTKPTEELTSREREIALLVAEGLSNKRIAMLLNVTEGTVKIHLHNVFAKLEVSNRTALATLVISKGTIPVAKIEAGFDGEREAARVDDGGNHYPISVDVDGRELEK